MRKKITLALFLTISLVQSQIPNGYYDSANGSNYELKTQLFEIINNQIDQGYNALDDFILQMTLIFIMKMTILFWIYTLKIR
jgi:hypothetical protein